MDGGGGKRTYQSLIGVSPGYPQASLRHLRKKEGEREGEGQQYFSIPVKERTIGSIKDCHLNLDAVLGVSGFGESLSKNLSQTS